MSDYITLIINLVLSSGLVSLLLFYNSKKRKSAAEALGAELSNELTEVDRLEARLRQRDDKVDALYQELRKEQAEKQAIIIASNKTTIELEVLKVKRCDTRGCLQRHPPSEY